MYRPATPPIDLNIIWT